MRNIAAIIIVVTGLGFAVVPAAAQAPGQHAVDAADRPEPRPRKSLCVIARPYHQCGGVLLAEVAIRPQSGSSAGTTSALFELGALINDADGTHAWGGTIGFLGQDGHDVMLAFKARYRRWLADGVGVDVAPGVVVGSAPDGGNFAGAIGHVGFDLGGVVGLTLEAQAYDAGDGPEAIGTAGIRFGAPVLIGVGYAVASVAAAAGPMR